MLPIAVGTTVHDTVPVPASPYILAAGSHLSLVNVVDGFVSQFPQVHHSPTSSVDLFGDGLVSANANIISLWDFDTAKVVKSTRIRNDDVNDSMVSVRFINQNLVAAAGTNRYLNLYDVRTPNISRVYKVQTCPDNITTLRCCDDTVFCGSADGTVVSIDLRQDDLQTLKFKDPLLDFHIPSTSLMVGLHESSHVSIVNPATATVLNSYGRPGRATGKLQYHIKCAWDQQDIVCGTETGTILRFSWEPTTNMILTSPAIVVGTGVVNCVAFVGEFVVGFSEGWLHRFPRRPDLSRLQRDRDSNFHQHPL
ncbi:hypothetical protein PSN45_002726 [Yamadazyma tenuis]|uniref:uncharacterized protein n=1 Tax=Candida tenuis TaxID=2315449 RepID=UPI0027A6AF75|nr:hypothetical protein PSN45_002726 [Yamadazyma tenuis]